MLFYLAVSLMLAGGRMGRNAVIGAALVLPALAWLRYGVGWQGARLLFNAIYLEFAAGAVLAWLWRRGSLARAPIPFGLALAAIGVAAVVWQQFHWLAYVDAWEMTLRDQGAQWRVILFGVPAALIVAGVLICERAMRGWAAETLARLGDASYSLYLVHALVLLAIYEVWTGAGLKAPSWFVVIFAIGLSVALSVVAHRRAAKPLLAWVRTLNVNARQRLVGGPERARSDDLRPVVDDLVG
jgi:exopolysaccharide production protein ExoZ